MIDAIPGPIVKRVCQVQSSIEAVAKTQFNKQGGYKFASADDKRAVDDAVRQLQIPA